MNAKLSAVRALKFSLSDIYNNLLKIILANLFWTACFIPSFLIGMQIRQNFSPLTFLMLVASFLLTSPALGGMFHLSRKIALNEPHIELGDFFQGVKKYWKNSLFLLSISLIIPALTSSALIFYAQVSRAHLAGIILSVMSLWAFIFFLLTQSAIFR